MVEEPTVEETVEILRGLAGAYAEHHGVAIADEALVAAARLSDRYVTEYRLPDKAIDLVDQAAARVRLRSAGGADLQELQAHKQAAIDAEEYEEAARLKARIDALQQDGPVAQAHVGETEIASVVAA